MVGGLKGHKEPHDGVPAHSASSALHLRDVGRIHAEATCELFLCEPTVGTQCGQSAAEVELRLCGVNCVGGFRHSATVAL